METVTTELFPYEELDDAAKSTARDWFRSRSDDYFHEYVYDAAVETGKLFGVTFADRPFNTVGGHTRHEPAISYTGFSSQGDGACFEGRYRYVKGAVAAVKAYAPQDKRLHAIVEGLAALQKRYFYALAATTKHQGYYYHAYSMVVDATLGSNSAPVAAEAELTQLLRDFANWIYAQLEQAYDYQNSDEAVAESLIANDYRFTKDGNHWH